MSKLTVELIVQPKLNEKTRSELSKIIKDIKKGKNLSLSFESVDEAIAYLRDE